MERMLSLAGCSICRWTPCDPIPISPGLNFLRRAWRSYPPVFRSTGFSSLSQFGGLRADMNWFPESGASEPPSWQG